MPSGDAASRGNPWVTRFRLVHPFPSLLDGAVAGVVAVVAGAELPLAARLGASMVLLQFAIGALNDLSDAEGDAGRQDKAIPAGLISRSLARAVVVAAAGTGLLLALLGGPAVLVVALAGLGIGVVYDLRAKGTAFSWVPLAAGAPLLPVFGWLGATGRLPGVFLVLVPAAVVAGAALAISNAVVDVDRDVDAGGSSIAVALGIGPASVVAVALQVVLASIAVGTAAALGAPGGWLAAIAGSSLVPVAGAILGVAAGRRSGIGARELAWEIQAVGTGLLAVAWINGLGAALGSSLGG